MMVLLGIRMELFDIVMSQFGMGLLGFVMSQVGICLLGFVMSQVGICLLGFVMSQGWDGCIWTWDVIVWVGSC